MPGTRWLGVVAVIGCGTEPNLDQPEPNPPDDPAPDVWGKPISGGTLLAARDGRHAVISDPDRDRVVIVDLETAMPASTLPLAPGSEPGRVIEDGAGRFH